MSIQILLNRIEYIRSCGDGKWRGKCPVHQGDNRSTLSITEKSDGMILLYCHAHQCPPLEILKVCGLDFSDIMPERLTHHASPQQRRKWREDAMHRDWDESRKISLEAARVIWIAGDQITAGRPLDERDAQRLRQAMQELDTQGRILNG